MTLNDRGGIGEYLVTQRKNFGWSQEFLAKQSNVSLRTVRNLETGRIRNPRQTSIDLLVRAFESASVAKGDGVHNLDPPNGLSPRRSLAAPDGRRSPTWLGRAGTATRSQL